MHQPIDPLANSAIKFIRMNTGEDLLAGITYLDDKKIFKLENPLRVIYAIHPKDTGRLIVTLTDWVFPHVCESKEFYIKSSDIVTTGNPNQSILSYYKESVTKKRFSMVDTSLTEDNEASDLEEMTQNELQVLDDLMKEVKTISKRKLH